ncbi:hypothetical protein VDGD_21447 [Verticillium dahliae]|nr:hypothetical protein VDGD_21447 [Verticillium dahliae]
MAIVEGIKPEPNKASHLQDFTTHDSHNLDALPDYVVEYELAVIEAVG